MEGVSQVRQQWTQTSGITNNNNREKQQNIINVL